MAGFSAWFREQILVELPTNLRWGYFLFALCLFTIIGTQSMIYPIRTSVFYDIIGAHSDPKSKIMVPLVLFPLLFIYNALYGFLRSPRLLITIFMTAYAAVYAVITVGVFMYCPANSTCSKDGTQWLAYLIYYTTETKSVILPVMMWTVINDLSTPRFAKSAYPPIVFFAQIGALFGSVMSMEVELFGGSKFGGSGFLLAIQTVALLIITVLAWRAVALFNSVPRDDEALIDQNRPEGTQNPAGPEEAPRDAAAQSAEEDQPSCHSGLRKFLSAFEGLYFVFSRPFVFLTFWVSCAHLVPRTFLDYQGSVTVKAAKGGHTDSYVEFMGMINTIQAACTMLMALLGTRKLIEKGGVRLGVMMLPILMLCAVLAVCIWYDFWVIQVAIIAVNTIGYGLNGPSREMLWVKTSKDIKYKAKSWSDMYGNFLQKSIGSAINIAFNEDDYTPSHHFNRPVTGGVTVGWFMIWVAAAATVGTMHKRLMESGKVVS